jgi:Flp pilus assembly protein TadG
MNRSKKAPRTATRARLVRTQTGAASIEFALILLPFCLLLMGMIDYGWFFFVDHICTNAVREGARRATTVPSSPPGTCPNSPGITAGTQTVTNLVTSLLPSLGTPDVTATCTLVGGSPQYQFTLRLAVPRLTGFTLVPVPETVQTRATMRGI